MSKHEDSSVPEPVNYDSPRDLGAFLELRGLGMRKRYGQNFLVGRDSRERIAALFETSPGDLAWEVGPGIGAMTRCALLAGVKLSAFEIDEGFADFLAGAYGSVPDFRLYRGDFIATWKTALADRGQPSLVFGNLPYNAAAAIIATLVEGAVTPSRMVYTVQREAARRMTAKPGTKDYSSFTVLCRSAWDVRIAFDLSPGVFWPVPKVTSSVVTMRPRPDALPCAGSPAFTRFTRSSFASRRKTIRNNLKAAGLQDDHIVSGLASCGFRPDIRAEALSPSELASLFETLSSLRG